MQTAVELLMKYENQWVFLSKEQIDYMLDENLPPLPQTENGSKGSDAKCPNCGAMEVDAMSPRTIYECGSSDYDQRPNTFKQSEGCKGSDETKTN